MQTIVRITTSEENFCSCPDFINSPPDEQQRMLQAWRLTSGKEVPVNLPPEQAVGPRKECGLLWQVLVPINTHGAGSSFLCKHHLDID